ncbi:MAG TPA: amino acid adenylation domain-containing protein, partial [Thermoanaerobaculia bacterium]|nr:amino acid adenylation domain-containing protein [Thermoanaerobaculia bacterium]
TPRGASPHLRAFLLRSLPEYMVPAAFVALPAFPLTPSGKVDRRALPTPERDPRAVSVAPRTRTEEALAEIWKELLGLEQVSVGDSFFELGGHSLLAFQVVGRVREALGVEIALREIFEAPAIAGLAARIDARSAPAAPGIARVPRDGDLPLSFAQQRLWFLDQLDPGTPAYNIPLAVRVTGALSVGLLEWIFAEVVRRHEALRTLFAGPMQVVAPPWSPRLPVIDLSGLPDREALVHGLAREEAARPFDLARGPLLRLSLLRLGERDHLLLMTMHHIVSDGWSMGVLLREIAALYEGSPLPELTLQYADFAVWQRDWLRGEILETQLSYWRRQLAGAPKVLELPWDRPRPPLQTSRGASRSVALSSRLSEALQGLCRRVRVTPFMALLAGWALLLGRHAGQEDMLLGTPTAGRSRRELEGLIGVFVNTLVLRTDLAGPPDFAALLDQARQTALDAYTHQDLPFERLVEELVPERDLSHSPLFQAMLVLQNTPGGGLSLPGLTLTPLDTDSGTAQLDLTLVLQERRDGVFHGALEHNTDLFDGSTAARLWDRFTALLEAAVASPALPLSELPLLPAAERHQALVEWNDTAWAYRFELGLHEQVARQAESRPDAVAVSFEGQALSYRELDRRANRLAHRLIGLGVEPEARVAVLAERSPELIVALLGILKAGGVYVPLDPAYPRERLDFMREDSGAAVLLPLDEDLEGESGEAPLLKIEAEQIAYVLYTSGSTGRPKGVMVPHGALVRYVEAVRPVYGIGPGDRVLQFCSVSFDTSLEEILPCLAGGAELVLRTDAMLESPAVFLESCGARGITALSLPTAYWHEIAAKNLPLPPHLRLVILGGERALLERVESWRQHTQGRPRLVNSYGVTEATIVSTAVDLEARSAAEGRGEVSIGRVLRGTEAFLLDREGQPVPPGALGELHLGGGLLARGYLGRPDLTAERVVPHPFAAEPGGRLYRTGDLARALADGALEFAGRADRQIKVRGYRIEIEEIEARLLCHPEVEAAVVAAREDPAGEKRIVAYVVPHSLPGPAPAALRAFVREALPDYMVPGAYVELAALPLSPNGKVDRRAVSASAAPERASFGEGAAAPSDPVEELLAGIWSEVLGLERVGAHDDFFALGGHSLLATQVVSRIRTVLGIELPLRRLFETPTLVELAQAVRKSRESQAPPIVAVPRDGDLPLSFAQQRLWFLDRLEPGSPAYNMPLAVRLAGEVDPAQLEDIFFEVVRRHEALRTTFASRDGMPIQVIAAPRVELPVLDLSLVPESEALRLAREEAGRPFDLERGPLLRLALIRLGERDHVLLMTLHHIISDGWSMGVLLREVAALCEDSPLPELPVQYADFAVWQRSWLRGEVLEAQLAYWRRQLGNLNGAPRVLELPLDRPRPAVQTFRGASLRVALTAEAIHAICRREGATPFMVLLAAWAAVLGRHAGQEDVLVGTPIAGRNRREVEGLIGFFVNTLALRADLSGDPGFTGLLGRMRRTALDGYAHQDVPFERLVEELVPERDMAHSPLFQVLLALQNAPGETLSLEGLDLTPLDVADTVAKFDLTLSFAERQGFEGALEYNTDLFDGSTVMRLWARFTVLLEAALAAPDRPLSELPLLRPEERHQAFLEWNDTARSFPGGCLHELVTRQAERTPDAVAASFEGQQLSYGELERRANRLAHRLTGKPDVRIGVMLERSLEMIVALLGVLKAGAAYIPLDPSHPAERLALLLESSGARVVLSQEHLLVLDGPDTPPAVPLGEDNLAYVIYTSGSTGTPKGVMVPHRGIVNRLLWMQEAYPLTPGDRVLQKTPFTFDVSLGELFGPLLCGARLVFARPEGHRDPAYLADLIAHEGITALHFVPSMLGAFLEVEADLASVRRVLASGEALPPELVRRFSRATDAELLNLYGPTEASVEVSVWPCDPERPTVAIGRPISNLRLYVLQPVGVPGELLLGGVGLARGYLGRPDLTAAAFVPDPFGNGERLYRTGDFCRLLPDGNVEFLGRIDHQVKIRGFRIELGEVEAALLRHPQVRECAVVVREETLAAYVVGTAEPGVLRTFLDERLPGYMVPAVFVTLGALPLTSSGKVDRASLPTPERTHQALAPRDVLELRLVRLWEELLGLEPIGVQDDFFELGGHSLLATQVRSRLRTLLGVDLPLRALFEAPTL